MTTVKKAARGTYPHIKVICAQVHGNRGRELGRRRMTSPDAHTPVEARNGRRPDLAAFAARGERPNAEPLLVPEGFVPLQNFQSGNPGFRNTCWIAAVANLRECLAPVGEMTKTCTWKQFILTVRREWGEKYAYDEEHDGQDDAAELLGDILYPARDVFGMFAHRKYCAAECGHSWTSEETWPLWLLDLPARIGSYAVSDLVHNTFVTEPLDVLRCDTCGRRQQGGTRELAFQRSLAGKLVFRINRYGPDERRSDRVRVDEDLSLNGEAYHVEAILQHEGANAQHGHYIMFLRTAVGWELRDDSVRTMYPPQKLPPYQPENVYVLVYAKDPPKEEEDIEEECMVCVGASWEDLLEFTRNASKPSPEIPENEGPACVGASCDNLEKSAKDPAKSSSSNPEFVNGEGTTCVGASWEDLLKYTSKAAGSNAKASTLICFDAHTFLHE